MITLNIYDNIQETQRTSSFNFGQISDQVAWSTKYPKTYHLAITGFTNSLRKILQVGFQFH